MASGTSRALRQRVPFDLHNLPRDLMVYLFEQLTEGEEIATAISLGLSCRALYHLYWSTSRSKSSRRKRKLFNLMYRTSWDNERLQKHLDRVMIVRTFLGPHYRLTSRGSRTSQNPFPEDEQVRRVSGARVYMLPSPFSTDEDVWLDEVEQKMEHWKDMCLAGDASAYVLYRVRQTWPGTKTCELVEARKIMAAWEEWTTMIGF